MSWQAKIRNSIKNLDEIDNYNNTGKKDRGKLQNVITKHPMQVTRYYLSLINWDDPNDPIKKMAIPAIGELNLRGSYDTSGEAENTKMPGLQHKYPQTALILATNRCATYCRFCFRKRLIGLSSEEVLKRFEEAVLYINKHREITNVLISGGDPFVLPTKIVRRFLELLSEVPHLDFIRFGTRTPVTFPARIIGDKELVDTLRWYSENKKKVYISTHYNHPREITEKSVRAVDILRNAGITINNQTVLLKGVNDNPETLANLQRNLARIGVIPYYVFQCRPVKRVKHHFQVSLKDGYEIIKQARTMLDGYSKRFRYVMSHKTGKIEIVGIKNNKIYLRYHQAKSPKNRGEFFERKLTESAGWLDDLKSV